jgi:hypothetical protein
MRNNSKEAFNANTNAAATWAAKKYLPLLRALLHGKSLLVVVSATSKMAFKRSRSAARIR